MKSPLLYLALAALILAPRFSQPAAAATASRPNVLFIIADDASRHFGEAYGCSWVTNIISMVLNITLASWNEMHMAKKD